MIYYLIPLAIIITSLSLLLSMIARKLPKLATINVDSIITEKNSVAKNRIILQRLVRKSVAVRYVLVKFFRPLVQQIVQLVSDFYQKIINLEQLKTQSTTPLKTIEIRREAKDILATAHQLLDEQKIDEAETAYIKVLELEKDNHDAYSGLVEVYLANRDYKKARETCRYNLKLLTKVAKGDTNGLKHKLASCHADLGYIYQLENRPTYALKSFEKAVGIEPNNPRFLDLLLKISIMLKRKELAWRTFNALKESDPENQKLAELKEEIDALQASSQAAAT